MFNRTRRGPPARQGTHHTSSVTMGNNMLHAQPGPFPIRSLFSNQYMHESDPETLKIFAPVTSQDYTRTFQSCGGTHTIIRIRNISSQALVGGAIWGVQRDKDRRNKLQPILLSITLSLRKPFRSAAQSDKLNDSTVNYGTVSKEILKFLASRRPDAPHAEDFKGLYQDWSLYDLLSWLALYLAGHSLSDNSSHLALKAREFIEGGCASLEDQDGPAYRPPLLDVRQLLELEFMVFLPKATLMSGGVSLSMSSAFAPDCATGQGTQYRSVLKIHNVRVPTLIGVNENERLAKQVVIVNVEVDPYVCEFWDYYNELEQIIVKTTEESSFETLESLATHLSSRIIKYFIYPYAPYFQYHPTELPTILGSILFSQVRICLEKPSAVMFADAPAIEIIRSSDPNVDEDARRLHSEWLRHKKSKGWARVTVPFPLQGTLSSWIKENCPGDTT